MIANAIEEAIYLTNPQHVLVIIAFIVIMGALGYAVKSLKLEIKEIFRKQPRR